MVVSRINTPPSSRSPLTEANIFERAFTSVMWPMVSIVDMKQSQTGPSYSVMSAQIHDTVPVSSPDEATESMSGERSTPVTVMPFDAR